MQPVITEEQIKKLSEASNVLMDLWEDGFIDMPLDNYATVLRAIVTTYDNTCKKEEAE